MRAATERAAIERHPVVIVCGETGSGKTTQIPKILLEMGRGEKKYIGHTQPRRIAARSVAARIAEELKVELGGVVGYKVRFTDKVGPRTQIKLMTDGILLAETQGDPALRAYDTIVLDEAHERSLNIDFLLGYFKRLLPRRPAAVIEGDQQTSLDADRIRAVGAPAVQLNTGRGCHLEAHGVGHALDDLAAALVPGSVLFIENVGNLVCPALFDLGEAHKVVLLSVTEGDDKPLKYPDMFAAADLVLISKIDLLPHVQFDVERCLASARLCNPTLTALSISASTGAGMDAWLSWLDR